MERSFPPLPCGDEKMNPSRDDRTHSPTLSLSKTLSTSLVVYGAISFVAMFYPLYQGRENGSGLSYFLPWCLPYGVFCLCMVIYSLLSFGFLSRRACFLKINSIVGIIFGALGMVAALPIGIFLKGYEFMISLLVIGACVIAISVLTLKSYRDEFKTR